MNEMVTGPHRLLTINLSDDERLALRSGLAEWSGPRLCTAETALAMGFLGQAEVHQESRRMLSMLNDSPTMKRLDWARALIAISFVLTDVQMNEGQEWKSGTAITDGDTMPLLRSVHRTLTRLLIR